MIAGNLDVVMNQLRQELEAFSTPPRVAVKINLSSPPRPGVIRTDVELLRHTVSCLADCSCEVTIAEGANGHLKENLSLIGLDSLLNASVHCMDLDLEEDVVLKNCHGRQFPLPLALTDMDLRIALPGTTKRAGHLFSGNVKTMVGLLPRRLCQNGEDSVFSRPMIHEDLTETVSDLFLIVQKTMPFRLFINGGNTISDACGITRFHQYYIGSNAVAMDECLANQLQVPLPDYLKVLKEMQDL